MKALEALQPRAVWKHFEAICAIPHGSGNTGAIRDYCAAFAGRLGLYCRQDAAGNLIIKKPGTPGYEDHPPILVQGHLDMVAVKTEEHKADLARDGIVPILRGDWVSAENTSLGGDDGIAVAMALALLEDRDLPHPPLEILLTSDEEIGMLGAIALDGSCLQSRTLLNLDNEKEGELLIGCAGGVSVHCTLPAEYAPQPCPGIKLTIGGLRGGHSGSTIQEGRPNACKLMGQVLRDLGLPLAQISAPGKDNAIAVQCHGVVCGQITDALRERVARWQAVLRREYPADPGLTLSLCPVENAVPMKPRWSRACLDFLFLAPDGMQSLEPFDPKRPRTSLNLGVMETDGEGLHATFLVRSSIERQKAEVAERLRTLCEYCGGTATCSEEYPAWEPRADSPLCETLAEIYREQTGKTPVIQTVHAGLECGVLLEKLPGADAVSIGPDIQNIHTTEERLSVSSVERIWALVLELLRRS